MTTYKIVRFFRDIDRRRVIATGLTLEQAQAHCRRDDTHGDGWFDGYDKEDEETPSQPTDAAFDIILQHRARKDLP